MKKVKTSVIILFYFCSLLILTFASLAQPPEVKIICEIVPAIYDPNFEITYQQGILFWDSLIRYSAQNGLKIFSVADTSDISIGDPKPFNRAVFKLNNLQWSNGSFITFDDINFTITKVLSQSRLDQFKWARNTKLNWDKSNQENSFIFSQPQRNADIFTFPIIPYNYNSTEQSRYFEIPVGSGPYNIVAPFGLMGERHFKIVNSWHGFSEHPSEYTPFPEIRLTSTDIVSNLHTGDIAIDVELAYGKSLARSYKYIWESYEENSSIFVAFNCRQERRYFVDSAVRKEISSYLDRRSLHIVFMGGEVSAVILPTIYPCVDEYYNIQLAQTTANVMTTRNDVVSPNVKNIFRNVDEPLLLIYQDVNTFKFHELALSIADRLSNMLFNKSNMVKVVGYPRTCDPQQRNSFENVLASGEYDLALMYWNFGYSGAPNIEPLIGAGNPLGYIDIAIDELLKQIKLIDPAQLHEKFFYYIQRNFNADSVLSYIDKSQSIVRENKGASLEELRNLVNSYEGVFSLSNPVCAKMIQLVEDIYDFDDWDTFYKTKYDLIQEHMYDNPPAIPLFNAVRCFLRKKELKGVMVYQGNVFNSITEWHWEEQ